MTWLQACNVEVLFLRTALTTWLVVAIGFVVFPGTSIAKECPLADLAAAVDELGVSLRTYNRDAMPKVSQKLRSLGKAKGWPQTNSQEETSAYLADQRLHDFDERTNSLFAIIDALGPREDDKVVDCDRIRDLRASGVELLSVMREKSQYIIAKIDNDLAPKAPPPAKPAARAAPAEIKPKIASRPTPPQPQDTLENLDSPGPWNTKTKRARKRKKSDKGYTLDEIRNATKGFFGTISTNLASVIEYAFENSGRPSAYILGNEGGGAFLAGVRYGKGTLYLRDGGRRDIYWHGPSVGSDFGASGSRTMFLIYDLPSANSIYRSFTGVDGSAYFVGGVGITYLQGGDVVMAPIRSGIGFRLGANLGYVRFTRAATWNPF